MDCSRLFRRATQIDRRITSVIVKSCKKNRSQYLSEFHSLLRDPFERYES